MNDPFGKVQLACKEWASVCAALSASRQHILLRKGGVAEAGGEFEIHKGCFLLYPTFVHQQETSLREPVWLARGNAYRPVPGKVRFFQVAQMIQNWVLKDEAKCEELEPFHVMTRESVLARFHYRKPGLNVLLLRCYNLPIPMEIEETVHYQGCKSWVDLQAPLSVEVASPVMDDGAFSEVFSKVRKALEV